MGWLGKALGGIGGFLIGGPAGASAGMSIGGAIDDSSDAKKAAKKQAKGYQASIDEYRRQFDLTREDFAPYRQTGTAALNQLAALQGLDGEAPDFSTFYNSPGYQFNRSEGLKAVEGSAAARGGLYSGNALRALQDRGSNIASLEFGNHFNRLASLAGIGQSATNAVAGYGAQTSGNVGNALIGQGDARASGVIGSANALNSGIRDLASLWSYGSGGGSMPSWGATNPWGATPPIWGGAGSRPGWRLG